MKFNTSLTILIDTIATFVGKYAFGMNQNAITLLGISILVGSLLVSAIATLIRENH